MKITLERIEQIRGGKIPASLLPVALEFIELRQEYDDNFDTLLRTDGDDKVFYQKREFKLDKKCSKLRKKLGIYLSDPCKRKNCYMDNPKRYCNKWIMKEVNGKDVRWCPVYSLPTATVWMK